VQTQEQTLAKTEVQQQSKQAHQQSKQAHQQSKQAQ